MLHTAEMISAVCITPQRQTAHCGDEIEIFSCLWWLLKGQSGEIPKGMNTSINYHERKDMKYKLFGLLRKCSDVSGVQHTADTTL